MSFGLPYPTGGYPLNPFNGGSPAQNPHFGSISPNGLNLGLVNVNPLVSFQFAKNEFGEKTFKPLVNLHVTPNENIINKVGNLFKNKNHGFGGGGGGGHGHGGYNQHYHTHSHFDAPSGPYLQHHHHQSPHFDGPIHHYGPALSSPPFESSNTFIPHSFSSGPPHDYYPSGYADEYGFSSPPFYHDTSYHANTNNNIESSLASPETPTSGNFQPIAYFGDRSLNNNGSLDVAIDPNAYAGNFANYNPNAFAETMVNSAAAAQAAAASRVQNTQKQGTQSVSFPKNRRKRNVNGSGATSDIDTINEAIAPNAKRLQKVIHSYR